MTRWHGGKGQTQRPVDKEKFESEFDRIFNKDKGKKDDSIHTNKARKNDTSIRGKDRPDS